MTLNEYVEMKGKSRARRELQPGDNCTRIQKGKRQRGEDVGAVISVVLPLPNVKVNIATIPIRGMK